MIRFSSSCMWGSEPGKLETCPLGTSGGGSQRRPRQGEVLGAGMGPAGTDPGPADVSDEGNRRQENRRVTWGLSRVPRSTGDHLGRRDLGKDEEFGLKLEPGGGAGGQGVESY